MVSGVYLPSWEISVYIYLLLLKCGEIEIGREGKGGRGGKGEEVGKEGTHIQGEGEKAQCCSIPFCSCIWHVFRRYYTIVRGFLLPRRTFNIAMYKPLFICLKNMKITIWVLSKFSKDIWASFQEDNLYIIEQENIICHVDKADRKILIFKDIFLPDPQVK